jgi:hypothetical protein
MVKFLQKWYKLEDIENATKKYEKLDRINDEKLIGDALMAIKVNLKPYERIIRILQMKFRKFNEKDKGGVWFHFRRYSKRI